MDDNTKNPKLKTVRDEDFENIYANVVRYESNAFDLKVVLGEIDLSGAVETHRMHTGLTIPWSAAKIAIYYLTVNIMFHEALNGKVKLPPSQIPPMLELPPEAANDPVQKKIYEGISAFRDQFIKDNF
jgi:hypothetical protein